MLIQISTKVRQSVEKANGGKPFPIFEGPHPRVGEVGACSVVEIVGILVALADKIADIDPCLPRWGEEAMEKLTELEDALLRLGARAVCKEGLQELYQGLRGCLPQRPCLDAGRRGGTANLGGEEDPSVRASTPGGEEAVMASPDHLARRGEKRSQEK